MFRCDAFRGRRREYSTSAVRVSDAAKHELAPDDGEPPGAQLRELVDRALHTALPPPAFVVVVAGKHAVGIQKGGPRLQVCSHGIVRMVAVDVYDVEPLRADGRRRIQ